ncbi:hypothetical protein BC835DRAFT_84320 [Cytidiella melzeri]|nr:hypothetical protein BC835DRAFT_84320 [Cytidiella melzeri]
MEVDETQDFVPERPAKRFKHQSYKDTLKQVHLVPALLQKEVDDDIGDTDSHFHTALQDWRELSLAPAFIRFANKTSGLSASISLLLHHWKEIIDLWLETVAGADDEALKPLLEYVKSTSLSKSLLTVI